MEGATIANFGKKLAGDVTGKPWPADAGAARSLLSALGLLSVSLGAPCWGTQLQSLSDPKTTLWGLGSQAARSMCCTA